ncbi:hypothetical protein AAZX31_12G140600 [Glycine max]
MARNSCFPLFSSLLCYGVSFGCEDLSYLCCGVPFGFQESRTVPNNNKQLIKSIKIGLNWIYRRIQAKNYQISKHSPTSSHVSQ